MKALLLSFSVGLVAALQAQAFPASSEEPQDVSGKWYLKATAYNVAIPEKKLEPLSVTPVTIKTLEGGNLQVKVTVLVAGHCREMNTILEKTDEPGKYTTYGGQHVVYIVKSPVEDHYIFYYAGEMRGHEIQMAKLVGRDRNINEEALEDFKNAAGARGLNTENIFIPKQAETCSPGTN
uniref:von Ebner gland protein 2-like n=1 Tax=Jaculus jaculus TaxID=51337 RepID=UPI001E1B21F9|nr:von Ebner gland protein 2-like [Jaculus jaculus]